MVKVELDLSDDGENGESLQINKAYAERYDNWRRLEEMQKLKDKYGSDVGSDDESTSSEEPADWSADHERDFLRTLAALKTHDPKIYSDEKFFTAQPSSSSEADPQKKKKGKKNKEAPMYLKDYERKLILERGGLKAALQDDSDGDDSDTLLKKREKSQKEIKKEEDEYYEWLKGHRKEDIADADRLKGLRDLWNDASLDKDEKFLRDYLLNKEYETNNDAEIPTYDEIVNVEEDEEEMEREKEFERKFNFRFEEPDQEFIKQYPRTVKESLRKADDKRKERRDAYKARKKEEKRALKEQIKELRALKKAEIEEKLKKLRHISGDDQLPVRIDDLEEDFDPAAYDKRMEELFNNHYYEQEMDEDAKKPVFSDVSSDSSDECDYDNLVVGTAIRGAETSETDGDESLKEQKPNTSQRGGGEEGEFLFREKKPTSRRKKRNSRFAEAVLRKKPLFDPREKTFEEYFNEYYALDYEDIIGGDITTRFKYRTVPANSFGLTVDEILSADDRQLNAWASLKKATAYRTEAEERYDIQAYEKKARNVEKKRRIFSTDFGG
ncbi:unnamed protein product [Toxocara canis]|uniref:Protein KRI1 homolog n=1 Tax=Toxocara canis TaxID=6265 RepID=A0A183UQI6_TOXCA|nr:unnamed protein product [Toxocara canis]